MNEQISIFEYMSEKHKKVRPCECGNDKLAVRWTGCGIPKTFEPHVTYDQYLFCVFCPKCFNVAMSGDYDSAWRSNKLTIEKAISDWNEFHHRNEADKQNGMYGHKYYADIMPQTLERFPRVKEVLYTT